MHEKRGSIKYLERYKQLNDFTGLRYQRNITPSDIDGVIDFGGNAFVFLEGKLIGAPAQIGQDILFKNLCDSIVKSGLQAIVIYYHHNEPPDKIINVSECDVFKKYWNGEFSDVKFITVSEAIEVVIGYWRRNNIQL